MYWLIAILELRQCSLVKTLALSCWYVYYGTISINVYTYIYKQCICTMITSLCTAYNDYITVYNVQ